MTGNNRTESTKQSEIKRDWHLFNLEGQTLGRVASQIAQKLIGKEKPYFTSHLDCGDYVVVVNAEKVIVSGNKVKQKKYYRHSGYPGGFRELTFKQMMDKDPTKIIEHAVKGMLPKNKLRDKRMRRLKIFIGDKHPYSEKVDNHTKKKGKEV